MHPVWKDYKDLSPQQKPSDEMPLWARGLAGLLRLTLSGALIWVALYMVACALRIVLWMAS